jgi:RNA polymerase sigma-70 factor, ECF subfamily
MVCNASRGLRVHGAMEGHLRVVPEVVEGSPEITEGALAFDAFYGDHFDRVYTALFLVTGNRHEAEEIAQESFLRIFERWDRVSVLEDPVGYVYRSAMNVFRNRYRRASVALRRAFSLLPAATDELERIETRDEVVRLLRELTPQQRAAVLLTSILDFSVEDASKVLGLRPASVRSLTSRARDVMKRKAVETS